MKVEVDINVSGYFHWEGNVDTKENAIDCALEACGEADFGPLEDIDYEVYSAETVNGQ